MNNKLLLGLMIGVFGISFIIAGIFIINNFSFTFDVQEPLSFEYSWIEDYNIECNDTLQQNYIDYSGVVDAGRIVYPGNNERICFKIESLSNGDIPLFVNFTTNEFVESYDLNFPIVVNNTERFGNLDFVVAPDAEGTFAGTMTFGRGN